MNSYQLTLKKKLLETRAIAWAASNKLLINSNKTRRILFSSSDTKSGGSKDQLIIIIKDNQ